MRPLTAEEFAEEGRHLAPDEARALLDALRSAILKASLAEAVAALRHAQAVVRDDLGAEHRSCGACEKADAILAKYPVKLG